MIDLNTLDLPALYAELDRTGAITAAIEAAWREDADDAGDVTSRFLVPEAAEGSAVLVAREAGVVAGLAVVEHLGLRAGVAVEPTVADGTPVDGDHPLATLRGSRRSLLRLERTALNFVARCSGIATLTRRYVQAAAGTRAVICDTRKTTPGLRHLEKYAVRCGGATLHRVNLSDAVLVKDNHLAGIPVADLAGVLAGGIERARAAGPLRFVEVEVDTLEQLDEVLAMPAGLVDVVLLDNMDPRRLREAVERRDGRAPNVLLEASGGVTLATAPLIAATGVDRISVGALTHAAIGLDVGLDVPA
jgi:nicotinate-nucleotide pyrophosphorylase (carboxylating)